MGHWSVAFSECETDPIFKKITVNYEKNAYEKSVNFWELCEALQWEWCLYDVCSTRLYCYDLHLLPAVQKVQPASQARAVTSLNSFTVPGLYQPCVDAAITSDTEIWRQKRLFTRKNFEAKKRIVGGHYSKKLIIHNYQYYFMNRKTYVWLYNSQNKNSSIRANIHLRRVGVLAGKIRIFPFKF